MREPQAAILGWAILVPAFLAAQSVESPTTAPANAWLVEGQPVAAYWSRPGEGFRARTVTAGSTLLTRGMGEDWDLQFGWLGWASHEISNHDFKETVSGFGDGYLRAKWNVMGDEYTGPALSLLPYVKVPLADSNLGNGKWEPGIAVVFGAPLSETLWVEAMADVFFLEGTPGDESEYISGGVVVGRAHGPNGANSVYGEVLYEWNRAFPDEFPITLGLGMSWQISPGLWGDIELLAKVSGPVSQAGVAFRFYWLP